jgi:hypothetical protein
VKTAGIAIDSWKLPIFKKHLEAAGYAYTQHLGLTADTLLLKVKTERLALLLPIVKKANAECQSD